MNTRSFIHRYALLFGLWLLALSLLAFSLRCHAQPPQRIIIAFYNPISEIEKQQVAQIFSRYPIDNVIWQTAGNSERQIVVISPRLEPKTISQLCAEITQLETVQFAEPDQMLFPQ